MTVNVDQGNGAPEPLNVFYRFDGTLFFGDGVNTRTLDATRDGNGRGDFNIINAALTEILNGNYEIVENQ